MIALSVSQVDSRLLNLPTELFGAPSKFSSVGTRPDVFWYWPDIPADIFILSFYIIKIAIEYYLSMHEFSIFFFLIKPFASLRLCVFALNFFSTRYLSESCKIQRKGAKTQRRKDEINALRTILEVTKLNLKKS